MNYVKVCLLVLLAVTARAQMTRGCDLRDVSVRWADYYATAYHVPVELVEAIIDEESSWNPYAISSKGAAGIMQLMPQTAVRFGVHNRFRVEENIHGGVAYIAWLKERFNGDLRLITAAYYVGEYYISLRGLDYSSADVQGYVRRVSQRYRARRFARMDLARRRQNEVMNEKSTLQLVFAINPSGGSQCTANDHRSATPFQTNRGPQDHND